MGLLYGFGRELQEEAPFSRQRAIMRGAASDWVVRYKRFYHRLTGRRACSTLHNPRRQVPGLCDSETSIAAIRTMSASNEV